MKIAILSAAAILALGLAACSPADEREAGTSSAADGTAADTGAMAPGDGTMTTPPSEGTMTGSAGSNPTGSTGVNPDGTPMTQTPDDQSEPAGTEGTPPPVQ